MNLYLRLAWRNIWRHKRRTAIIVLAMSLTLSLMMFYDGLMNGFTDAIYGNAVKVLGGNIQVHADGYRADVGSTPLLPLTDAQLPSLPLRDLGKQKPSEQEILSNPRARSAILRVAEKAETMNR